MDMYQRDGCSLGRQTDRQTTLIDRHLAAVHIYALSIHHAASNYLLLAAVFFPVAAAQVWNIIITTDFPSSLKKLIFFDCRTLTSARLASL